MMHTIDVNTTAWDMKEDMKRVQVMLPNFLGNVIPLNLLISQFVLNLYPQLSSAALLCFIGSLCVKGIWIQ